MSTSALQKKNNLRNQKWCGHLWEMEGDFKLTEVTHKLQWEWRFTCLLSIEDFTTNDSVTHDSDQLELGLRHVTSMHDCLILKTGGIFFCF